MFAAEVVNSVIVLAALASLVGFSYLWSMTQARGFALKSLACLWALMARSLLVAGVEPFVTHSAPLILPFWILLVAGVWMTVRKLRSVYKTMARPGSDAERRRVIEAAELVKKATAAAALAAQVTAEAAAAALAAKERALEAHRLVEEAQKHVANGG